MVVDLDSSDCRVQRAGGWEARERGCSGGWAFCAYKDARGKGSRHGIADRVFVVQSGPVSIHGPATPPLPW